MSAKNRNNELFYLQNKGIPANKQGYRDKNNTVGTSGFVHPNILEGRPGEFRDFLLAAISSYANEHLTSDHKRALRIAREYLKANGSPSEYEKRFSKELSQAFKDDPTPKGVLKKHGFDLRQGNKHSICEYCSIKMPLSCTPSDKRAKRNELSNFKKTYFVIFD
jgi:hypothetical protein